MLDKHERTLEMYKYAGAYLRLFSYVKFLGYEYLQPISTKSLIHKFDKGNISDIRDELERRMLQDFPEFALDDFIPVFYGSMHGAFTSLNPDGMDAEITRRSRDIFEKQFMQAFQKTITNQGGK